MFTLSGAHVFPMYDGAVKAQPPMQILDVRHEQTAAFAAEATGKLTRTPGLAVLTAGPGVTNGVSAVAQARFGGSPLVVVGGRAPANRWGTGSLQELDQPPIFAPVSKLVAHHPRRGRRRGRRRRGVHGRGCVAPRPGLRRRPDGRVLRPPPRRRCRWSAPGRGSSPTRTRSAEIAHLLGEARRPVLVLGTDVWADVADEAALRFVEGIGIPTITNGMGRGVVPGGHPLLVTKARSAAFGGADLVVVVGTPLDFRLGYGVFGGKEERAAPARVVHVADSAAQVSGHADLAGSASGDLTLALDALHVAVDGPGPQAGLVLVGDRAPGHGPHGGRA